MHRYFAFGSNMLPARLTRRIGAARCLGVGRLDGMALTFNKKGTDGSGKCTVEHSRAAFCYGVVYEISDGQMAQLTGFEGPGYVLREAVVSVAGKHFDCALYQALPDWLVPGQQPFSWYLEFVRAGARVHRLPAPFQRTLSRIRCIDDPDPHRHQSNLAILRAQMKASG